MEAYSHSREPKPSNNYALLPVALSTDTAYPTSAVDAQVSVTVTAPSEAIVAISITASAAQEAGYTPTILPPTTSGSAAVVTVVPAAAIVAVTSFTDSTLSAV